MPSTFAVTAMYLAGLGLIANWLGKKKSAIVLATIAVAFGCYDLIFRP
ncbi:MAG: hypothetical protein KW788_03690 [Candidatus Doudnabacteria bacterium]|nr:hypothetical protein [Candidatus Doudnabacteria bacterium]